MPRATNENLGAPHALAAVVAKVAVAAADGDGAAAVATGGVELEAGELGALDGVVAGVHAELGCSRVAVAVAVAVGVTIAVATRMAVTIGQAFRSFAGAF